MTEPVRSAMSSSNPGKLRTSREFTIEVENIRRLSADVPSIAVEFLGETAMLVFDGAVLLVPPDKDEQRVSVHEGAVLSAAADGRRLLTSGDDGRGD